MRAAAYGRVSSEEQAKGLSLESQRETVLGEIARRGWECADVASDAASGKSLKRRPGLERLLGKLQRGELDALVVSRLDRLSRSTLDFYDLLGRADREGWALVCLHPSVDMSDPMGRAMAGVAAVFAQLERELISMRQLESVQARIAAGTYTWNRGKMYDAAMKRILELHVSTDLSCGGIARRMEAEGYPSPLGGGFWHSSAVWRPLGGKNRSRERSAQMLADFKPLGIGLPEPMKSAKHEADDRHKDQQHNAQDVAQVGHVRSAGEARQAEDDEQQVEVATGDVGHMSSLPVRRAFQAHRAIGR